MINFLLTLALFMLLLTVEGFEFALFLPIIDSKHCCDFCSFLFLSSHSPSSSFSRATLNLNFNSRHRLYDMRMMCTINSYVIESVLYTTNDDEMYVEWSDAVSKNGTQKRRTRSTMPIPVELSKLISLSNIIINLVFDALKPRIHFPSLSLSPSRTEPSSLHTHSNINIASFSIRRLFNI